MARKKHIAIIGCGPAGLATSLYLRRAGHKVTVFEAFERPHPVGSGLMLQPSGMCVLYELGLLNTIIGRGQCIERISGRDAFSNKSVLDVRYHDLGANQFGIGIHRHGLFKTLYEAAQAAGVSFEFGVSVEGFENKQSGISPIGNNGNALASFDYLIFANGSNSEISCACERVKARHPLSYGALWATLDWQGENLNSDMLEQRYKSASKMVGVLPLGNFEEAVATPNKAALFWSITDENFINAKTRGIAALKDEIHKYWPETEQLLNQISGFDDFVFAQYYHYTLNKPYGNRYAIIGDAYHSTSPQLGQGANMALLDAKAVAEAINEAGENLPDAGYEFYQIRSRHIAIFQRLSYLLTPFYQSDSKTMGWVRDHVVSYLVKIPPAPKLMALMVSGMFAKPFQNGKNATEFAEPNWRLFRD